MRGRRRPPRRRARSQALKASDISDLAMLCAIQRDHEARIAEHGSTIGGCWWTIAETSFPGIPEKIVRAKLAKLHHRQLIDGCPCGCRGDWNLSPRAERLLIKAGLAEWDISGKHTELRLRAAAPEERQTT